MPDKLAKQFDKVIRFFENNYFFEDAVALMVIKQLTFRDMRLGAPTNELLRRIDDLDTAVRDEIPAAAWYFAYPDAR
jgi:hypothetical protein